MNTDTLTNFNFIPFRQFTLDELYTYVVNAINDCQSMILEIEKQEHLNIDYLLEVLYPKLYKLNQLWTLTGHLLAVDNSEEIRIIEEKLQPQITEFYTNFGQSQKLYQHLKLIYETQTHKLSSEEAKILENELISFRLSGISLDDNKKYSFKQTQLKLAQLQTKFEQNIIDATNKYAKYVSLDQLSGVPINILEICKQNARLDNQSDLYKITLHQPIYAPILTYCDNRELRQELYYHYTTRASELANPNLDNSKIIVEILKLRAEKAKLLGFDNFVDLSIYTKMAESSTQILDFLFDLAIKSRIQAQNDIKELEKLAHESGIDHLEAWDIAYFSEKLQQAKYSYSNEELKQYFQLPVVLNGLFALINRLYQIEFKLITNIPTWHDSVSVYSVLKNKEIIGYLYLDLFARDSKQPGAWMNSAQDKFITKSLNYKPLAYIMCNFAPILPNTPSLLTFNDVQTLFHEMGHALHHLLTKISLFPISGINGVEWDAVELPSQFMEYFTWDYEILTSITKHAKTSEVLPFELYQKLNQAKHFQSGLHMLRQLEFAIFDIQLHLNPNEDYKYTLAQVRNKIAVIQPPEFNRFANTFSHIFAGGYAAGYYSYKWAEVLAAEVYSRFDNISKNEYSKIGNEFYSKILCQGGLHKMSDNFRSFMGRDPQVATLLHYSGIAN